MSDTSFHIVAIDGGAASGKSSTSRGIAEKLNLLYVDTGSHYRMVTYHLMEEDINHHDLEAIAAGLRKVRLDTRIEGRNATMTLNGQTIPYDELRSPVINANVSLYAAKRPVRQFLLNYQRGQAEVARVNGFAGLVMEGRDIATVIFPDADFKFFLEASEDVRARRREQEGQMDLVKERDNLDSTRSSAPFVAAGDARVISTDELDLDTVIDLVCAIIRKGGGKAASTDTAGDGGAPPANE